MFRFVLSRFMFMFVVVMACACTSTRPASGATTMGTPTDPFATARSVVDFASIVMPLVRGAVESLATTDEARADVRQAIDVVTGVALPGLRAGLSGYQGRADQCAVYRASGAFADALVTVGRKLGDVGYQIPPEVLGLLQSSGGLLDELAPRCTEDAGFSSIGASNLRAVADVTDAARRRGVFLRPFPPLTSQ